MTTVANPVEFDGINISQGLPTDEPQILIVTCHPDRYRSIGQPLTLTPEK